MSAGEAQLRGVKVRRGDRAAMLIGKPRGVTGSGHYVRWYDGTTGFVADVEECVMVPIAELDKLAKAVESRSPNRIVAIAKTMLKRVEKEGE